MIKQFLKYVGVIITRNQSISKELKEQLIKGLGTSSLITLYGKINACDYNAKQKYRNNCTISDGLWNHSEHH